MTDPKIHKGDRVEILPQWQDEGDADYIWFATEEEDGGRVSISPVCDLPYPPVNRVRTDMVRKVDAKA